MPFTKKVFKDNIKKFEDKHRAEQGPSNEITLLKAVSVDHGDPIISMMGNSSFRRRVAAKDGRRRLVARNLPFHQSHNYLQIRNHHLSVSIWNLLVHDWFHVVLRINLFHSMFFLLTLWTIFIFVFAGFYMALDRSDPLENCGLGAPGAPILFGPAFAFSLETCTTVGYGLPGDTNAFFEDRCNSVQLVIYLQMVWSMMFNAFLFAFFFARIAKSESRGVQVVFTKEAIINYVNHKDVGAFPSFQFRVFDVDSRYPVVEAHVRLYAVMKNSLCSPQPLRIVKPNDELGSMLFTSLPNDVCHVMDAYSLLTPNKLEEHSIPCITTEENQEPVTLSTTVGTGSGLDLRQADSATGGRDDFVCPICGESYGTLDRLIRHGQYTAIQEREGGIPVPNSHQQVDWQLWKEKLTHQWSLEELEDHFVKNVSEIVCVVEGIDPLNSGTFQALHSYQVQDIQFANVQFADCITVDKKKDRELVVDLKHFHRLVPADDSNADKITDSDSHVSINVNNYDHDQGENDDDNNIVMSNTSGSSVNV